MSQSFHVEETALVSQGISHVQMCLFGFSIVKISLVLYNKKYIGNHDIAAIFPLETIRIINMY